MSFAPIYGSLLAATLAAAAAVGVIVLVTPPTDSARQRRWLIGLRLVACAVLLLGLYRPTLVRADTRPGEAALIVAVDTSQSMTLPDGRGSDRWSVQTAAWQQLAEAILEFDETLDVRLIGYDAGIRELSATIDALDEIVPTGNATDLSAATLAALRSPAGRPLAGVVLMGDGAHTAPQTAGGIGRAVDTLASLGVPLWSVPIGPAGSDSASRDVAIDALPESYQMFADNEVSIDFQVVARSLVGSQVPVRLTWIDRDDNEREVAVREVIPAQSADVIPLEIPITAPAPGTYRLRVTGQPQPGELITTNNTQTAFVDVRAGGGRILVLSGTYRYEETFLRRALRRFPDLDLTQRQVTADTAARWPVDLGDALAPGRYDIYILGDLPAAAIGDAQLQQLTESVAAGAGLLTLGGFQTYSAGGYASSPLADVLPVNLDATRRPTAPAGTAERPDQLPGPVPIQLTRRHGITDLGGADPAELWSRLPPLPGANRLLGPKVAPGVEVLLETDDEQPLLVVGGYGRGRVAALAIDSTWRWWRGGYDEAHRRFWRQLMLWLLAREESSENKVLIELDARRFAIENPPSFRAEVAGVETDQAVALAAEVIADNEPPIPVESIRSAAGSGISGRLPELSPGFYQLRVRPADPAAAVEANEVAFQVIDQSLELTRPMADPVFLQQLAAMTSDYGGAAFAPEDLDALIETIRQRRRSAETPIVEQHRLGDDPVSGWILFAVFTGALSTEWLLRRRWGLA